MNLQRFKAVECHYKMDQPERCFSRVIEQYSMSLKRKDFLRKKALISNKEFEIKNDISSIKNDLLN